MQHYSPEALNQAMEASHYTLQYRIYTHAVTQWLQQRIPDFDYNKHFGGVVYLFLRGVREGRSTAVFKVNRKPPQLLNDCAKQRKP